MQKFVKSVTYFWGAELNPRVQYFQLCGGLEPEEPVCKRMLNAYGPLETTLGDKLHSD
jgi:hypothetical protein